jgi:hypothetical protein
LNQWQLFTGGTQRFKIYTQTNNNVFLESTSPGGNNTIFGIRTGNGTASGLRMLIMNTNNTAGGSGRMALGHDLPETFNPTERLHLHHEINTSPVRIRFTNQSTGVSAGDGTYMGIQANGTFRLTQHENASIEFRTPANNTVLYPDPIVRFQVLQNGQVLIGSQYANENVIDGGSITGFGSFTVFGSDLSRGTYTYSLVADGIVVATKRMVKE